MAEPVEPGEDEPGHVRGQRVREGSLLLPPQAGRQGELQVQGELPGLGVRRGDPHVGIPGGLTFLIG